MPLTITLEPEREAFYREEARRAGVAVETLVSQRLEEAELIYHIRRLSETAPDSLRRYRQLLRRRRAGVLSDAEQQEMLAFSHDAEARSAERLRCLIRLAALWKISVPEVMNQLNLRPPRPI